MKRLSTAAILGFVASVAGHGQTATLQSILVSASRAAPADAGSAPASDLFDRARLNFFPTLAIDETLREDPSFSLFRRTSSMLSNPTSQGVSLRGIGPSGASRSLVILDGVPLNDPFGGWVLWAQVPRLSLARAEIVKSGGSGTWGNAALAGAIELVEAPPADGAGRAEAELGAYGTRSAEAALSAGGRLGTVSVDAAAFTTDGVYDVPAAERGAVDRRLNSDHQMAEVSVREPLGSNVEAVVTGRFFQEARGNGTALQNNGSKVGLISAVIDGQPRPEFSWNAVAYAQDDRFHAFFTSVNAARSVETPANDQYDVPATAAGAAFTARWQDPRQGSDTGGLTEIGADARQVIGETREDFLYSGGAFTRVRFAGGLQDFAGAYLRREQPLGGGWSMDADARLDRWANLRGHDREYDLASGAPTVTAAYSGRRGNQLSPDIGLTWKTAKDVRIHASAFHGFRLPTLNEYYRPFRVGSVSTLANPDLAVETLDGGEAGIECGSDRLKAGITAFADELHNTVGTVVIASSPATTTVERQNLDRVFVRGMEGSVQWRPVSTIRFELGYLWNDTRIQRASAEPDLEGLRLPEVPRTTATAEVSWHGPWRIEVGGRFRWVSLEFNDPQNQLRLPSAGIADVTASRPFGKRLSVFIAAENVGNAAVATDVSPTGLVTYDAPRLLRLGAKVSW